MPAIFILRQQGGRAHANGHVQVVSAGMHDRDLDTLIVMSGDTACVGEFCFLGHRKRVEFCANHNSGAGTVFQHADNPGTSHMGRNVVAKLAKLVGDSGRSLLFVKREFRVAV